MWTTDYEADIASDLSVFHRIDDPMEISGPRYFELTNRLTAYTGVLQARAIAQREEENGGAHGGHTAAPSGSRPGAASEKRSRVSDTTALAMLSGDGWAEHVEGSGA